MMPNKPLHPCNQAGCPMLTGGRYCDAHAKKNEQEYDLARGTATERGYGVKHRKWRSVILNRDPLCVLCLRKGIVVPSTEADHIDGNNRNLSYDNGQGLCKGCHSAKTAREQSRWGPGG